MGIPTDIIPTQPGVYWFQGWETYFNKADPPALYCIECLRSKANTLLYRMGTEYVNPSNYYGIWTKIPIPPRTISSFELNNLLTKLANNRIAQEGRK